MVFPLDAKTVFSLARKKIRMAYINSGKMPLTLFTTPKPFIGHIGTIQRNAIYSWTLLEPRPEIIIFGDESGSAEVASEFGFRHVPDIARNEFGTPFLDDIFKKAHDMASNNMLCYINADIILMSDFMHAVVMVAGRFPKFLMVGQRWNLDIKEPLRFNRQWEDDLRMLIKQNGVLYTIDGIDYFVFLRGLFNKIPPFLVGRVAWDNWLLYYARAQGASLVDTTQVVTIVHQNHNYAHVKDFVGNGWSSPEFKINFNIAKNRLFSLLDANWLLSSKGFVRPTSLDHRKRAREAWFLLHFPILCSLMFALQPLIIKGGILLRSLGLLKKRNS